MSNLEKWDRFADIDPSFTKQITGKAYKGISPNPQYVIRCLTELFGPVGEGFGWEILREDFTPLGDEILHWCRIRFWHGSRDNFFESYGQTKALMKTKSGFMSDEDAPKKSLTDAIVKAASQIGIAANIFLGRWDDQKYVSEVNAEFRKEEAAENRTTDQRSDESRREVQSQQQQKADQNKPASSAEQKRQLAEIDKDLLDCHSDADVKRCADVWQHIATRDQWSRDFKMIAKDKFDARRKQLAEADDFPGDFPGSNDDIRNHVLNAG